MSSLDIRAAEDADYPWAAKVMADSEPWITLGREYDACLRACTHQGDQLLVAWLDAARVGFIIVREGGVAGSPYIPCIDVVPPHRSGGVGSALLAHVESLCRHRARYLFLCVSSFNLRARSFYERHGFSIMGEFPDFIMEGASELLMGKRLRDSNQALPRRSTP